MTKTLHKIHLLNKKYD